MKFKKKQLPNQPARQALSDRLNEASRLITSGQYAEALSALDAVAVSADPERKCQIASLAAQAQFQQGKFAAAAVTYAQAWQLGATGKRAWFGAALGKVRAELCNVEVENAYSTAQKALTQAQQLFDQFGALAATIGQTVAQNGSVTVERAPIRPSVAAFKLGQQFWQEGEADKAAWFFEKATQIEPQGACRARIALANIALVSENFQAAYDGAKQALTMGQFHAKTLCAWPVLISAARKLGRTGIEQSLINGLAQAPSTVRGRAKFSIARALRAYNDPAWLEFITLQAGEDQNSILQAELAKLKAASARSSTSIDPAKAASELLATPNLGPKEWLSAAKKTLVLKLTNGGSVSTEALISEGVSRYGQEKRAAIRHGLALACQKANRADQARSLLREEISSGSSEYAPSVWLLAKLERDQGNAQRATDLLAALSKRPDQPERFRLLATVEWVRSLIESGDVAALTAGAAQLVAATEHIQDYELLLDIARQMTQAPEEVAAQAKDIFERGQKLARQAIAAQEQPSAALEILFKLARRQSDFNQYKAIVQTWEALPQGKRDWLWSPSALYWQYLALVVDAYRTSAQLQTADSLAEKYLEDSATPPNGLAEIGIPHALSLLRRGNKAAAFNWFQWTIDQIPTHVLCAYAYYWLTLEASKAGNAAKVQKNLESLHLSLGSSFGLAWMKNLDARARLLAGDTPAGIAKFSNYSEEYLQQQADGLKEDLQKL